MQRPVTTTSTTAVASVNASGDTAHMPQPVSPTQESPQRPVWMRLLIAFAGTAFLFLSVGMLLPKDYAVSRSLQIEAPVASCFDAMADLQQYAEWNPWRKAEPDMKVTFGKKTKGVDASYAWESTQSGSGSMKVVEYETNRSVVSKLEFGDQGDATVRWTFEPVNDEITRVTWSMEGELGANPLMGWMTLMMDSMVGTDFEQGLELLAERVEG